MDEIVAVGPDLGITRRPDDAVKEPENARYDRICLATSPSRHRMPNPNIQNQKLRNFCLQPATRRNRSCRPTMPD